jgi:hypothetical protein
MIGYRSPNFLLPQPFTQKKGSVVKPQSLTRKALNDIATLPAVG